MDTIMGLLVILPKGARMNQQRYIDEALKPHFVPFYKYTRRKHGKEVIIQEDRAKYYFAKKAVAYKLLHKVVGLIWPLQSPDLSPIKKLWKQLKDRISHRRHRISIIEEIKVALRQGWARIEKSLRR